MENPTTKECGKCYKTLSFDKFSKSKSGRFGYANYCKACRSKVRKEKKFDKPKDGTKMCRDCKKSFPVQNFYADKSNSTGLQTYCKDCGISRTKKWSSTVNGYCKRLFSVLKNNCKKRTKDLIVNITEQDILDLYTKQNGKCALTGKQMTMDTYMTKNNHHIINNYNVSVDRIDSDKGYEKDNIQLVCAIINRMKTDLTDQEFIEFCKAVVTHTTPST
jgi:hypothetical protein